MTTSTLGIIGSGPVGRAIARRALDAGLDVILSNSRTPETLADLVAELNQAEPVAGRVRAATPAEAAAAGDLVVVAALLTALERMPREPLSGKTVIDTMNYVVYPGSQVAELDSDELTSSGLVQRFLAGSRVVKVFHSIGPKHVLELHRPAGAPDRTALPISGDDPAAKQEVTDLLDVLGFDALDLGPLAESWRSEPNTPLYALPYIGPPPEGLTVPEFVAWAQAAPGIPVPAARIKELAVAAVRGPAGFRF